MISHLPREGITYSGLVPSIDQQLRKCPLDMPTSQSDGGNSSNGFLSSKYVMLATKLAT